MRPHNITDVLMPHAKSGFSINHRGDIPTDGYMVGGEVESLVIKPSHPSPYLSTDLYLERHWVLLSSNEDYYAGVWTDSDTGWIYVDICRNVADLYTALALASSRGELAVWDVASAKEVRTEEGAAVAADLY
jgi:hypothetical protein